MKRRKKEKEDPYLNVCEGSIMIVGKLILAFIAVRRRLQELICTLIAGECLSNA